MKKWLMMGVLALCAGCELMQPLSQAEVKALESRELDVPLRAAFDAGVQALFDLGYTIRHSEKDSGIIAGERQVASNVYVPGGRDGRSGTYIKQFTNYTVTLLLQAKGAKRTTVRIKYAEDGSTQLNRRVINDVWTTIDREVLMMAPAPKAKKK